MLDSAVRHSVGQPNTQNSRKLRDSCTDCASSKVKCSKEKPTCARCTRRGVTCTYMVSRRTGRTSSTAALSKGDPAQMWIGPNGLAASISTGSARPSARAMSLSGSSGPAFGTTRLLGGSSTNHTNNTNNHSNNNGSNGGSNNNHSTGTLRPSLRVASPLLSHATLTVTLVHDTGQSAPESSAGIDTGTGTSPDTDVWSSIFSPSTLMVDSAGLSPPLTTIGTDVGDLFDMDHLHSPMVLDCPEELASAATAIAEPDHQLVNPDLFGDMDLSVSDPDFASSAHTHASTFDWTLPSGSSGSSGTSTPNCCFAIALDLLTRLFPNAASGCALPGDPAGSPDISSSCPASAHAQARTIDSVVSENKQILESLTTLLDCPCSQDEYLISIMTLIALKVMGWYSAAAADDPLLTHSLTPTWPPTGTNSLLRTPPSAASRSTSPTDRRPRSASSTSSSLLTLAPGSAAPLAEHILRVPATVGNYCVAGQHQTRMAAQLVLSELHRVQRLVNALAGRLEGVRVRSAALGSRRSASSVSLASAGLLGVGSAACGGNGSASGGAGRAAPVSEQTFCLLEEDLRKRLRVLSRETIDVLRRA